MRQRGKSAPSEHLQTQPDAFRNEYDACIYASGGDSDATAGWQTAEQRRRAWHWHHASAASTFSDGALNPRSLVVNCVDARDRGFHSEALGMTVVAERGEARASFGPTASSGRRISRSAVVFDVDGGHFSLELQPAKDVALALPDTDAVLTSKSRCRCSSGAAHGQMGGAAGRLRRPVRRRACGCCPLLAGFGRAPFQISRGALRYP